MIAESDRGVGEQLVLDAPTERLCQAVADGRQAPARLAVLAPGRYGKTALLDRIERDRTRLNMPVYRYAALRGTAAEEAGPDPGGLVLVDDAHELGEHDFAVLRGYLADDHVGVVLAARPRPRPGGLDTLLGALGGQIVLRALDLAQTEEVLTGLGHQHPAAFARFVREQTGGVPGLVRLLGESCGTRESANTTEVPAAALTAAMRELDSMPADTLRLLLAVEAGAGSSFGLLAELLECSPVRVAELVDYAHATGLFASGGALLPFGAQALRALTPSARGGGAVRQQLAELALTHEHPLPSLVQSWLGTGLTGPAPARAFEAAVSEALPDDPGLAARLLGASVRAGKEFIDVGPRWAELAAIAGDLDTALRLADQVMTRGPGRACSEAARVAGIALAHRGQPARSAELLEWSGTARAGAFAALGLASTACLSAAERLLRQARELGDPPSLLSGAAFATATGLLESVRGAPTGALSELLNAEEMVEPIGREVLLPDSPAALAALVALHCGEPAAAHSVLDRPIRAHIGGDAMARRHRLLLGWTAMLRGDLARASGELAAAGENLAGRDWLFAVALEVGIARRGSDGPALRKVWSQAREAVLRQPVELLSLLPLGGFAVAAARLGEGERLSPHLHKAHTLLAGIGDPPLWAGLLHWYGLHAAITAEDDARAEEHADALAGHGRHLPFHATLAAGADCWRSALDGQVNAEYVEATARALADAGMGWDGARLAGQAAIRTTDRADMRALLDRARLLQGPMSPGSRAGASGAEDLTASGRLSDREREVGELVLAGMTYKEVGARLFISAKTVEHHMARMRSRLGAANRAELLAELRSLLAS